MKRMFLYSLFLIISTASFAQLREIPKEVREQFQSQYPAAVDVEYRDNIIDVHVIFHLDSARMVAKYTNRGAWKETERTWSFDLLPVEVKEGFDKSRYVDWKITETVLLYLPGGGEQFRIKVEKNELTKRYLFFNRKGRLVKDGLTL